MAAKIRTRNPSSKSRDSGEIRKILRDDKISWVSVASLKPWPNNARKHSKRQLAALAATIKKIGFANPVIIDENKTILCGHGRVEAVRGFMDTVPSVTVRGLSKAEKRAFVIADNKLSDLSSFDEEKLIAEIQIIQQEGEIDVEFTCFSTAEIDFMLDGFPGSVPADAGDIQNSDMDPPRVTCPDDLWLLGNHRLYCGNSLEQSSYEALMQKERAQMIFSDPPYNVAVNGHVRKEKGHREFAMASGEMDQAQFTTFLNTTCQLMADFSQDGSIHFLCMDWRHMREMLDATDPVYGSPKQVICWNKDNAGMSSFYRSKHELIFVFKNGAASHINNFGLGAVRYRTNVWDYPGVNTLKKSRREELDMHPTVKPVALVADAIRDCSGHKGIVLDPFSGSGTTIIAAERTGRVARCIELDPVYVDVTIARWMRVTGKTAIHAETGLTFEERKQCTGSKNIRERARVRKK